MALRAKKPHGFAHANPNEEVDEIEAVTNHDDCISTNMGSLYGADISDDEPKPLVVHPG